MIRLFISQPMKDKSNEQIEAERNEAIASVTKHFGGEPVEVIDSFFRMHHTMQDRYGSWVNL